MNRKILLFLGVLALGIICAVFITSRTDLSLGKHSPNVAVVPVEETRDAIIEGGSNEKAYNEEAESSALGNDSSNASDSKKGEAYQFESSALNRLVKNARHIDHRVINSQDANVITESHLFVTDFKYPLVRIDQEIELRAGGRFVLSETAAVADHIMLKVDESLTEGDVIDIISQNGYTIRKKMFTPNVYLIQDITPHIGSIDLLLSHLNPQENERLKSAESDYIVYSTATPVDTDFGLLWGMNNTGQSGGTPDADIDAVEAWDLSIGNANVVVGVIDTGIDYNHPDLVANMWTNPGEIAGNSIDDDGNGFIDDVYGWDFSNDDSDPMDDHFHGTHCAGTIGAVGNNSLGVTGVAWDVSLMAIKFLSATGSGVTSDAIDCVTYSNLMQVDLTSNSWGGGAYSSILESAIQAGQADDIVFVAAAGNDNRNNDTTPQYPADYDLGNIISVASTDRNDNRSSFSNYGLTSVDLGAPGSDILSTFPTYMTAEMSSRGFSINYETISGTSMATPHVAGACALIRSLAPNMSYSDVKTQLLDSVDPISSMSGITVTGGRLNVYNAILPLAGPVVQVDSIVIDDDSVDGTIGNGDGIINPGETIGLTVTFENPGIEDAVGLNSTFALRGVDSSITITQNSIVVGDLVSGAQITPAQQYIFEVSGTAPVPSISEFSITITDDSEPVNTWTEDVNLEVDQSATVSGTVTTITGSSPIPGAVVSYSGPLSGTAITDSLGDYDFVGTAGSYTISASASGYVDSDPQVIVIPPDASDIDFQLGLPDLSVSPSSIVATLNSGDATTETLTLLNTGDVTLNWGSSYQYNLSVSPTRDRSMDVIRKNLSEEETSGESQNPDKLDNGIQVAAIPFLDGFEDGDFGDWTVEHGVGVREVVSATSAEGARSFHYANTTSTSHFQGISQSFPDGSRPEYVSFYIRSGSTSLADAYFVLRSGSGEAIWFYAKSSGFLYVNADVGGDESYVYSANVWYQIEYRDIDWDDKHFDYYVDGTLIKADIPFRNASSVDDFDRLDIYNFHASEAWWDGIELLNSEFQWLGMPETSGQILPGESMDVAVNLDAANLNAGGYAAQIKFSWDDPRDTTVTVPVDLTVIGAPAIQVSPVSLDFGDVLAGSSNTQDLVISNTGTDILNVSGIVSSGSAFSTDSAAGFSLNPGASRAVQVAFSFPSIASFNESLTISSDDPTDPTVLVNLSGQTLPAPDIDYDPSSFSFAVESGETATDTLTLQNLGGIDLNWSLSFEPVVGGVEWLSASLISGAIASGESETVTLSIDADGLWAGLYNANVIIDSNDPDEASVSIPVGLQVSGAPVIQVSPVSLDFGDVLAGSSNTLDFVITNTGTDVLNVSSIVSSDSAFSTDFAAGFSLNPGANRTVQVTFSSPTVAIFNESLTILSDDPADPAAIVTLSGQALPSPDIDHDPSSFSFALISGETATDTLTLQNLGGADLNWSLSVEPVTTAAHVLDQSPIFSSDKVVDEDKGMEPEGLVPDEATSYDSSVSDQTRSIGPASSYAALQEVLDNLNEDFASITSLIPGRYDFSNGVTGTYISDGGGDMYDNGNYLGTDLGSYITYSDNTVLSSSYLGAAGSYFTRKHPGLFVFAADLDGVTSFNITGGLGADGSGSVDGTVLSVTRGGVTYLGFVKRVYGTSDPSVNHLIIVADNGEADHTFSTSTNYDTHSVTSLDGVDRIYYLLYASASGGFIDNDETLAIMEAFLDSVGSVEWLSVAPDSGTIASGNSEAVTLSINTAGVFGGLYNANIIIDSNDPDESSVSIPVDLQVTGVPEIEILPASLDFGEVIKNGEATLLLSVENIGTEILTVSDISSDSGSFTPDFLGSFDVGPGEARTISVAFAPDTVGEFSGELTIDSNASTTPIVTVALSGNGVIGPLHHFTWDAIAAPTYANEAFPVALTARDEHENLIEDFESTVDFGAYIGAGYTDHTIYESPSVYSSVSNYNYTRGYAFTPNEDLIVTHVRHFCGVKVSIWEDDGTLISSVPITAPQGSWSETELPSSVLLNAGETYRIAFHTSASGQYSYYSYSLPVTFGHGVINANYYASGDNFPTSSTSQDWYVGLRYEVLTGTPITMSPESSGGFSSGFWTGSVSIEEPGADIVIRARENAKFGLSEPIEVGTRGTLSVSLPASASEADGLQVASGTVFLTPIAASDLIVSLTSNDTTELDIPATITIPAGSSSATFDITLLDDNLLDGPQTVGVSAVATGYAKASDDMQVEDDEAVTFYISVPTFASESSGAVTGQVYSSVPPSQDISIELSSNDLSEATIPSSVVLAAGQTASDSFQINIIDDNEIDGLQSVVFTASLGDINQNTVTMSVVDNEHTNLEISLPLETLENSGILPTSAEVNISGTMATDLTISLSSNQPSSIIVPISVTIPSGSTSAYFPLMVFDDDIAEPDVSVQISASATGFNGTQGTIEVIDDDASSFAFSTIDSIVEKDSAFAVTITALDINGDLQDDYSGTAQLTASGDNGSVGLDVTVASFTNGQWSGSVAVTDIDTNVIVTATDIATGDSNSFDVAVADIRIAPAALSVIIPQGEQLDQNILIENLGLVDLNWQATILEDLEIENANTVNILIWEQYADRSRELPNTIAALDSVFTDYTMEALNTSGATDLATALVGKDVFLIPEQESGSSFLAGIGTSWADTLDAFVRGGGTIIFLYPHYSSVASTFISNTGLFSISGWVNFNSGSLSVVDSDHYLLENVSNPVVQNATGRFTALDSDVTRVLQYNTFDVLVERPIGSGKAIILPYDFYEYSANEAHMLGNAVKSSNAGPSWLSVDSRTGTVPGIASSNLNVNFDTAALTPGAYTAEINFSSNDPDTPILTIPVELLVTWSGFNLPGYITWRDSMFGINSPNAAPLDDFYGNGILNIFEFIFDSDPSNGQLFDNFPKITEVSEGAFNIEYTRTTNVDESTLYLELSETLTGWRRLALGVDYSVVSVTNNLNGTETVVITIQATEISKCFIRTSVEPTDFY